MRKSKKVLATLAATVFAASAGALVACSGTEDTELGVFEITFNANGGTYADGSTEFKLSTFEGKLVGDLKETSRTDYTFTGYSLTETGDVIALGDYVFTSNVTMYAQWKSNAPVTQEYTVTYNANGGTFAEGFATTVTTVNGKITSLPTEANVSYAGHTLSGWYTAAENGDRITSDYLFTQNGVTIYAQWTESGSEPGEQTVSSIRVTPPTKTTYTVGDTFDTAGMTVTAVMSDESEQSVAVADCTITGYDMATAGTQTVTVTYQGKTATFSITVEAGQTPVVPTVSSIRVTPPTKTTYTVGDAFDTAGMTVTAVMSDESEQSVAVDDCTITGYDLATAGTQTVTVTYQGKTATFSITVEAGQTLTDPNPPAPQFSDAVIKANDTTMICNTASIDRSPVDEGEGYKNHTLSDEYMLLDQTVNSQTVFNFTINNEPVVFRCECKDGLRVTEKNTNTSKVTVSAGTYSFYFKYYSDTNAWVMYVDGTSEGGGDIHGEYDVDDGLYIVGTHTDWAPLAANKGVGPTQLKENNGVTVYGNEYKFTVTFDEDETGFKIATYEGGNAQLDGWYCKLQQDVDATVATGGGSDNSAPNIRVLRAGNYEIYLKIYVAGGHDIWIGRVVGAQTITLNAGAGTLSGAATVTTNQFGQLTALPDDPTAPTGKRFDGWYTAATGGAKVAEGATFESAATIYARYVDATIKADGVYNGDTKLTANVKVNTSNPDELMITGLVLDEDTTVTIVYNGETVEIDKTKSGGDVAQYLADGKSIKLTAGKYDLYYTFGATHRDYKKLWAQKEVEGPAADKNADLTYTSGFGTTGVYVVGKFYSRGMNAYAWGDGYEMTSKGNGKYELKNIYLYEGDSFKVRVGSGDSKGHSIWSQSDQLSWDGGNANVKAGGEGYYTITIDTSAGNNNYEMKVVYHGANPAA